MSEDHVLSTSLCFIYFISPCFSQGAQKILFHGKDINSEQNMNMIPGCGREDFSFCSQRSIYVLAMELQVQEESNTSSGAQCCGCDPHPGQLCTSIEGAAFNEILFLDHG